MRVVLIGPICTGKSTVAGLLAEELGVPQVSVDDLRSVYFAELGYDEERAAQLQETRGVWGICEYWKPFEAHQVERLLEDYGEGVFDFGAGHSVYDDPVLFERVRQALAGVPFVILLLPCADVERAAGVLRERFPAEVAGLEGLEELNEYFVKHSANGVLATHVVYTDGKSPGDVCAEIVGLVRMGRATAQRACNRPRSRRGVEA